MATYTKAERAAINAAFGKIAYLCNCTNWSDTPQLREALKLERRETGDTVTARAMVVKAWHEGATNPDTPARAIYYVRPGYQRAFMLGVRHAVERLAGAEYTAAMMREALELAPAAIDANDAHTRRIVEG